MADFSAGLNKFIFPAYKYALGMNEITSYDNNNVALSWVTQDVTALTNKNYWTRDCASPFLRYSAFWWVPDNAIQFADTYLQSVNEGSINSKTEASGELTYQNLTHTEPEYYLFTKGLKGARHYLSACPVTGDLDYSVTAMKGVMIENGQMVSATRKAKYLMSEYNLSGIYSSSLYQDLNIPEDTVTESKLFKSCADTIFQDREDLVSGRVIDYVKTQKLLSQLELKGKNGSKGLKGLKGLKGKKGKKGVNGIINNRTGEFYSGRILEYGARGFILSYTDDKHVGGDMIPMAYYEFPRPLYSNQDYIKIVWNTNGFVEVE